MSILKIYNTLTRTKQIYVPIKPGKTGLYVCGMTVYDYCHLGHARVMVVFDIVQRWLRASGLEVTYVRNITDIDDKIIKRAIVNREPVNQLTQRFINAMHEDAIALGIQKPDYEPCATAYISSIVLLIKKLKCSGLAYQGTDKNIYFSVRNFPKYGKLSGKTLNHLKIGARVNINIHKRDPLDFILWKRVNNNINEPEDIRWHSPWGLGRPGWHIECSAMSNKLLGSHFDIHGGGQDLQFPHHENEIAQSDGANQRVCVNYWMHNGFVLFNNEKMSKSLNNFFTIRDLFKKYDPEVIRFFILQTHYRSPLNYSNQSLENARQSLIRLYCALKILKVDMLYKTEKDMLCVKIVDSIFVKRFIDAMNDDFNTPVAISILFGLAKEINKSQSEVYAKQLRILAGVIGLLQQPINDFLKKNVLNKSITTITHSRIYNISETFIQTKIQARSIAKISKNFIEADKIRVELAQAGIILEDKLNGITTWRRL